MTKPTLGESRIRVSFNPSGASAVDETKLAYANLIDALEQARIKSEDGEHARLCALAMTATEEAAMWAVKALTYS